MVINYDSLMELRAAWESLERAGGRRRRTTVLVLDRNFAGHLPSLIRRERAESRLIIAAADGPLPPLVIDGFGKGEDAGWNEIWCAEDWRQAVDEARRSLQEGEELALFWPSWHDREASRHRREGAHVGTINGSAAFARRGSINTLRGSVA
jgi:hypothetical protein